MSILKKVYENIHLKWSRSFPRGNVCARSKLIMLAACVIPPPASHAGGLERRPNTLLLLKPRPSFHLARFPGALAPSFPSSPAAAHQVGHTSF